ncbi:MAG TPA: AbrB/MazE/SpoVT family DNA-binding domain-containing protein [Gemmatimonadales bacterium]|jgi:AbrB family looped-hinge helix DNA binding protein
MLMKVHRKGQVVIPAGLRKQLGIDVGDVLEVEVIPDEGKIELRRPSPARAAALAGSLRQYGRGKRFPSERRIKEALRSGLTDGG